MRTVLRLLGITIAIEKRDPSVWTPITLLPRCRNAFYLSGYTPSTTIALKLRLPQGVPVPMGDEAEIVEGWPEARNVSGALTFAWSSRMRGILLAVVP